MMSEIPSIPFPGLQSAPSQWPEGVAPGDGRLAPCDGVPGLERPTPPLCRGHRPHGSEGRAQPSPVHSASPSIECCFWKLVAVCVCVCVCVYMCGRRVFLCTSWPNMYHVCNMFTKVKWSRINPWPGNEASIFSHFLLPLLCRRISTGLLILPGIFLLG